MAQLSSFYKTLFSSVKDCYEENLYCDVKLFGCAVDPEENTDSEEDGSGAYPDPANMKSVQCHSLVLCSVAPTFKDVLLEVETDNELEARCVYLPNLTYQTVKTFMDDVYAGLCSTEFNLDITYDLADVFGMLAEEKPAAEEAQDKTDLKSQESYSINVNQENLEFADFGEGGVEIVIPGRPVDGNEIFTFDASQLRPKLRTINTNLNRQYIVPSLRSFSNSPKVFDNSRIDQKRKIIPSGDILPAKKPRRDGRSDGVRNRQYLPMNRKVDTGPCKFNLDADSEMEASPLQILEALFANEGTLVTHTDHFYATTKVTQDKENTIITGGTGPGDNEPRQFRMKLPDKTIVAFLAVGIKDGQNLISTLACNHQNWPEERTFANFIEVIKNILGCSFGTVLRHSRVLEPNKEKMSPEMVAEYKAQMEQLGSEEQNQIAEENKEFLKEYDEKIDSMTFHHLPQKNNKMEFTLVDDIKPEDLCDYAIMSGDGVEDLIIQGLFNFQTMKYNNNKVITIMLDTLSCFLGFGNITPITQYPLMKDTFENYAQKTCQLLAVQELNQKGRETCRELIAQEGDNFYDPKTEKAPEEKNEEADSGATRGRSQGGGIVKVGADGQMIKVGESGKKRKPVRRKNLTKGDPGDEMKLFPCKFDNCTRAFDKETERAGHIARVHGKAAQLRASTKICPPCGKILPGQKELREHLYYHHNRKTCEICNIEFPGAYQFYYHNSKVHSEVHKCDVCGQEFKGREKLKVHKINKHLEDHQKPYVCSLCGKGYAHKTKLQSHQMNVHIRSRPYKCRLEGCDADFNELANRNAHEKGVHKFNYREIVKNKELEESMEVSTLLDGTTTIVVQEDELGPNLELQ